MRRYDLVGLVVVVLAALLLAAWLYRSALLPLASIGWDEGVHLLDATNLMVPVYNGAYLEALNTSFGQFFYPPGYSWILTLWSFISGMSLNGLRLWSLGAWVASGVMVYLLTLTICGKSKDQRRPVVAGFLAAGIFLTAPIFWIFATEAMIELTGTLVTLIVGWLILQANSWKGWVAVGMGLVVLHFVKYNYAVWMIGAVVMEEFLWGGRRKWRRLTVVLLPVIVMFFGWVVMPGRIRDYLHYFNDPNFYSYYVIPFWQHLVWFFPMALLNEYLASPWIVIVIVIGVVGAWRTFRTNRPMRIFGLIFLINFFFATIHFHNQQSRYIVTGVPFLYILAGVGAAEMWRRFMIYDLRFKSFVFLAIVVILIFVGRDSVWNVENVQGIGEHILSSPIYALSNYRDTAFDFDKSHWPSGTKLSETPKGVLDFIVQGSDPYKPLLYLGRANEVSPPALEYLRRVNSNSNRRQNYLEYAVTLEVVPGSLIDTYDYRKMNKEGTEQGLAAVLKDESWERIADKEFTQLGVTVTVWGKGE